MYDLIIVGGGPAGVAAGVYAGRKRIKALLVTDTFGGQSLVSNEVQNWIGTKSISGFDLGKNLEEHLREYSDVEIMDGAWVKSIIKEDKGFRLQVSDDKSVNTRTVLIATGSRHRKLEVPGEKELEGKGVAYCSTCDAPLFEGKVVAVIGGGNSGLEAVRDLIPYAKEIYLLIRSEKTKGDPVTFEKISGNPKVHIVTMAQTKEILGTDHARGLRYVDLETSMDKELLVEGVFVEIGTVPNSELVKGLAEINPYGEIIVDHKTQRTSVPGIWAAGDVCDVLYKQNNISVGDAIKAALNIERYLHKD